MDGRPNCIEADILKAINDKTLTEEKMKKGLIALIDAEMNQQDHPANVELIDACQKLLYRICCKEPYVSHKEDSLARAKKKLAAQYRKKHALLTSMRVAAILIVLIGGSFAVDVLIRNESLTTQSTTDGQQVEIHGKTTQGMFIADVQAGIDKQVNVIGSKALEDAASALGYYPDVPTWLPDGWVPLDYYASTSRYTSVFRMQYQKSAEENLVKFGISKYNDVESALAAFQQNGNGESYQWNGMTIYISVNIDEPVAIWLHDTICYSLSGPLSNEEIKQVIKSIQRSEPNNET